LRGNVKRGETRRKKKKSQKKKNAIWETGAARGLPLDRRDQKAHLNNGGSPRQRPGGLKGLVSLEIPIEPNLRAQEAKKGEPLLREKSVRKGKTQKGGKDRGKHIASKTESVQKLQSNSAS